MSQHDRGAYAPPTADPPLAFEARRPVRGAKPFPTTFFISMLVLLGLIAALFVFYRLGVRSAGQAPQAVGAPIGAIKTAPPADAQPQDPAAGLQIYQSESGQPHSAPAQPQFTPPPEQPALRPAPAPAPVTVAPAPAPVAAAPATPAHIAAAPKPAAAPAPKPAPVAAAPVAAPKPAAAAARPVATPPRHAAAEAVASHEKAPAGTPKSAGAAAVQIGAVASTSIADKTWNEAVAVAPGMAAGKGKGVERIEKDGRVLFRTSVTGFASRTQAAAFCAKLKDAGKACFVK
jgi:hypothetical protein